MRFDWEDQPPMELDDEEESQLGACRICGFIADLVEDDVCYSCLQFLVTEEDD